MLTRYPFDATGKSSTNLVARELHTLDPDTENRIIFTRMGGYYNDSLVVKQKNNTLVLNEDYYYTFFWQEASMLTGLGVSVAVQIINPDIAGDIELTYQCVGGGYQNRIESLDALLKVLPFNVRNVYWEEVLEKPEAYVPTRHLHHVRDVFGLSRLVAVIDDLRKAMQGQSVLKLKAVYDRFLKLKQYVEANIGNIELIENRLREILAEVEGQLGKFITVEQYETKTTEKITQALRPVNEKLTDLETELNNTNTRLTEKVTELNTAINNAKTELTNKINADVDNAKATLRNELNNAKSELKNDIKQTNDNLTALSERVTEFSNDVNERLTKQDEKITEQGVKLDEGIKSIPTKVAEQLNPYKQVTDAKLLNLDNRVTVLENKPANQIVVDVATGKLAYNGKRLVDHEDLNQFKSEVDQKTTQIKNDLTLVRTDLDQAKNDINTLTDKSTELRQDLTEQTKALNDFKVQVDKNYIDKNELPSLVDDIVHDELEALHVNQVKLEAKVIETDNKLQERISAVNEKLDKKETELVNRISDLSFRVNTDLETLTDSVTELDNKLSDSNNKTSTELAKLKSADTKLANDLKAASELISNLTTVVNDNKSGAEDKVNELLEKLENEYLNTTQLPDFIRDTTKPSLDKVNRDVNQLRTDTNTLVDDVNTRLDNETAALETMITDTKADLVTTKETLQTGIDNLRDRIDVVKREADDALRPVKNDVTKLKTDVIQINNDIAETNRDIDDLKPLIDDNKQAIADLKTTVETDYQLKRDLPATVNQLIDTKVTPVKTEINNLKQDVRQAGNKIDDLADELQSFVTRVITLENKDDEFDEKLNNYTSSDELTELIKNKIGEIAIPKIEEISNKLKQKEEDEEFVAEGIGFTINGIRAEIEELYISTDERLRELEDNGVGGLSPDDKVKVDRLGEILDNTPDKFIISADDLERLVQNKINELLAIRQAQNPPPPPIPIPVTGNGNIDYGTKTGISTTPIKYMDTTIQHDDANRWVFTPGTRIEYTADGSWTIPDIYDQLLAKVTVVSAVKVEDLTTAVKYYPPSIKEGYILLKAGTVIDISIGTTSKFGDYYQNDGSNDQGTVVATYPIVFPKHTETTTPSMLIEHGRHGRVIIDV